MAQTVNHQPLTADNRVHSQARYMSACQIYGGQSCTVTGFFTEYFGYPLSVSIYQCSTLIYRSPTVYEIILSTGSIFERNTINSVRLVI